jgi:hypothetical protein
MPKRVAALDQAALLPPVCLPPRHRRQLPQNRTCKMDYGFYDAIRRIAEILQAIHILAVDAYKRISCMNN